MVFIVVGCVWSLFALRWYLGNTLAEYFNAGQNDLDLAQTARSLAPKDPLTHWRLGQVSLKRLPLDQLARALPEFERAVSLSPNDYRLWVALGTAREQAGDVAGGEQALREAVRLAPSYAYPHWYLGNLLLRSNRYDEAFAELRLASEANPEDLQTQLFSLVSAVYGNDFEALKNAIGTKPETRAQFAIYLFAQKKFDEGLRIWNSLSFEEKKASKAAGDSILASLISNLRVHDAVNVWNDLAVGSTTRVEPDRITDGGFEDQVAYSPEMVFGWQVKNAPQMEIAIDPSTSHTGSRSLRIVFQIRSQGEQLNASQLVPVANNSEYEFECYVKTSKLQTGGPPYIQITDSGNGAVLVATPPAPNGDTDWNRVAVTFKTGEKTEAITIKIVRAACEDDSKVCPIFGSIWYDDFSIKRRN